MLSLSQAEENYLKSLYHLSGGSDSVSTNSLAKNLNTTPASANDMVRRLGEKKLVRHIKYRGATLTEIGRIQAINVIRKHRLWEVFLVDKLNFKWDEVHEIAEQLEHIKSPVLTERLDEYLGRPSLDPHGDPIPDSAGILPTLTQLSLSELAIGETGKLIGVGDDNPKLLQHLGSKEIELGVEISILSVNEYDQSIEVKISEHTQFLSHQVAELLYIEKEPT